MENKDIKIKEAVDKVDAKIASMESAGRPKAEYKTRMNFQGRDVKSLSLELLVALYLELSSLAREHGLVSKELDMDFTCGGYSIDEWKADVKRAIDIKKYDIEMQRLKKLKNDLESHFTEEYKEERIVLDLIGSI